MLIIKRSEKALYKKEIYGWIKEKLQKEEIKIIKGQENKKATKLIFKN